MNKCRALTLFEVMVAVCILALALASAVQLQMRSMMQVQTDDEAVTALNAARRMREIIETDVPFTKAFYFFNNTTADDNLTGFSTSNPTPSGLVPSNSFFVPYNSVFLMRDTDGDSIPDSKVVGKIYFPTDTANKLLETQTAAFLGMPTNLDLNDSGSNSETIDLAGTYKMLPVKVVVDWTSVSGGEQHVELKTILIERR
jgi:type II secretory pathway pseudopilin PulG